MCIRVCFPDFINVFFGFYQCVFLDRRRGMTEGKTQEVKWGGNGQDKVGARLYGYFNGGKLEKIKKKQKNRGRSMGYFVGGEGERRWFAVVKRGTGRGNGWWWRGSECWQ